MNIRMAHLRTQGIDFAVFDADATDRTPAARDALLWDLTTRARRAGLKVDKSALAFRCGRGIEYHGTPDLARHLARNGVHRWTHTIAV